MPQAVADQGKSTLYEVDADAGRRHTDKQRSQQRTLHEVVRQESHPKPPTVQRSDIAVRVRVLASKILRRGSVVRLPPVAQHHDPVD